MWMAENVELVRKALHDAHGEWMSSECLRELLKRCDPTFTDSDLDLLFRRIIGLNGLKIADNVSIDAFINSLYDVGLPGKTPCPVSVGSTADSSNAMSTPLLSVVSAEKIAYVSDVEGHWEYFFNFIQLCEGLSFTKQVVASDVRSSEDLEIDLMDGWHFVFGGDSCDKGPGTLRFQEAVVRLKKKYPERVHLILGNRDINKMRWTAEIAQSEIERFKEVPGAYWVPAKFRKTHLEFLRKLAADEEGISEDKVTDEMLTARNTKANKYKYCFKFDSGADGEFDFRRQELAILQNVKLEDVSDSEVVQSFEDGLKPGGWMREYLMHAQLGVLIHNLEYCTDTLFVHGQIIGNQFPHGQVKGADEQNVAWSIGVVPGIDDPIDNVGEWLEKLNAWARKEIEDWESKPVWDSPPKEPTYEDWKGRGASELLAYGTPGSRYPTVVYCRWLAQSCMPLQYPPALVEHLKKQNVKYVVVGHTPHGNAPTVIQHDGVTCVMADTSFSNMKSNHYYQGDNRGTAVSAVTFDFCDCVCRIQGITDKELIIDYKVHPEKGDRYVGLMQPFEQGEKQFFVKARLPEAPGVAEKSYLMSNINGFQYEYAVLTLDQVSDHLAKTGMNIVSQTSFSCHGDLFGFSFLGDDDHKLLDYVFTRLDASKDGLVSKGELMSACTDKIVRAVLLEGFPSMSFDEIFQKLGGDAHGTIAKEDFRKSLCSGRVLKRKLAQDGIYFEVVASGKSDGKEFPSELGPFLTQAVQSFKCSDLSIFDQKYMESWNTTGRECELSRDGLPSEALKKALQLSKLKLNKYKSLKSQLSPLFEVNLPVEDRKAAFIPENAEHFAWCYPFVSDCRPNAPWLEFAGDPDVAFLFYGGFVYFDKNMEVVAINAVTPSASGGLRFGQPKRWKPEWTEPLRKTQRWHPVTLRGLIQSGASEFCWLRPHEKVGDEKFAGCLEDGTTCTIGPFGAFAYLGHDTEEGNYLHASVLGESLKNIKLNTSLNDALSLKVRTASPSPTRNLTI